LGLGCLGVAAYKRLPYYALLKPIKLSLYSTTSFTHLHAFLLLLLSPSLPCPTEVSQLDVNVYALSTFTDFTSATAFDNFSKLPPHLVPTSMQVTQFASNFVKTEQDGRKSFSWPDFQQAVSEYPGDDLAIDKFQNNGLHPGEKTVSTVVDQIVDFLRVAVGVFLSAADIEALKGTIEIAFTNLREMSSRGFVDFKQSNGGPNSSLEYRIQIAFPNPDLPDYFYSLVTTIKLEANISDESEWWELSRDSSKNFSATIGAMRLIVTKGFRNPKQG
jgi:hypothetical protein